MKTWMKKLLIYGLSGVAGMIVASIVSGLAFHVGVLYALLWGIFGAGIAIVLSRLIYHLVLRDYAPEMWQIEIYMMLACGGWLGAILATTWGWVSLWLAAMCVGILMALGTRFCKAVAEAKVKSSLEVTLRYRFVDDRLGGTPDLDNPLTVVKSGQALTVEEAEKAGEKEAAERGRAYIRKITEGK